MLDKILETNQYVTERAKHVTIDDHKIKEASQTLSFENKGHWLQSNPFGIYDLKIEELLHFWILYTSIDYSFWGDPKWTIKTDSGEMDGAIALLYALLKLKENYNDLDFTKISYKDFKEALKGNVDIPLVKERYETIKETSHIIKEKMDNNFYNAIKPFTKDTELFDFIIAHFPRFKDERNYHGTPIYVYKLAQLLVSDILHIREAKENIEVDYSHLIGCADYKIPQILRSLGILIYDEELSDLIDNKKEIIENTAYEIEIRSSMLVALHKIKAEIKNDIPLIHINDTLWLLRQSKKEERKPYHLTRTTSY